MAETTNASPLLPGETLLWTGMPVQGLVFTAADWFFVPFSLMWGGFAFVWNAGVWTAGAPLFFKLFGLPFLAIGIYMIAGRFLLDRWRRARTHYAVTDRRVLISERNGESIRSLEIGRLPALEMQEAANGKGTIRFGPQSLSSQMGMGGGWPAAGWPGSDLTCQFFRIDDVRRVYELIRKTAGEKGQA